jgi:hypothetical protein
MRLREQGGTGEEGLHGIRLQPENPAGGYLSASRKLPRTIAAVICIFGDPHPRRASGATRRQCFSRSIIIRNVVKQSV